MTKVARYAERDIIAIDRETGLYSAHVHAMTAEGLHEKSDIAAELAFRDARIAELERAFKEVNEARHQTISKYFSLRIAIEALATEWKRRSDTGDCPCENPEEIYAICAAELLEVKP